MEECLQLKCASPPWRRESRIPPGLTHEHEVVQELVGGEHLLEDDRHLKGQRRVKGSVQEGCQQGVSRGWVKGS